MNDLTSSEQQMPTLLRLSLRFTATWIVLFAIASTACGYNPPADTAGPLHVQINCQDVVTETDVPVPVEVVIRNEGQEPVAGRLRIGVIDQWTVEPTAEKPFEVPAGGRVVHSFRVTATAGSYSELYPIHAFVQFDYHAKRLTAHPIHILKAELQRTVAAPRLPWKPISARPNSQLALWQVPVYRAVVQVFGEQPEVMPVGWLGSEERSRATVSRRTTVLSGDGRDGLAIHPPWDRGRVGTMIVEYPLELPEETPITLRFANATSPEDQGDGVSFRVRVLPWEAADGAQGDIVFERHLNGSKWQAAEVDLSSLAGRAVRLQIESDPGPAKNTGWDQSYWAEPMLTLGQPPQPLAFPPAAAQPSRRLGATRCNSRTYATRLWLGNRGLLDAVIQFDDGQRQLSFRGFEITVLGARIDQHGSPFQLVRTAEETVDNGLQVRHWFAGPVGDFQLVGRLSIEDGVLRCRFALEETPTPQPWVHFHLEDVAINQWSRAVDAVYAGQGNVVKKPGAYRLSFDGHRLATSFVGYEFAGGMSVIEAADAPPICLQTDPDRNHASLHVAHSQTRTLIPTHDVWQGVKVWRKVNGLRPASGVSKVAGRFVFDLWGGRYEQSHRDLRRALRYGLHDSMVVWHNWQRWGYDYRLPEIYPPNPQLGMPEQLRDMIDDCRREGILFALHDNYIDYYPDARGFSYEGKIAFHPDATPVRAWLNKGRDAQSYRYRADQVEPVLKRNLQMIRDGLQPNAYFIDVWSSARPYDYWTSTGEFRDSIATRNTWGELFAWIRDYLGDDAPQISESGHDQLIGWLDGAQANHLRVGNPPEGDYGWAVLDWQCEDAERIPWLDAAHHDRFVLHGAGYAPRYSAGLDRRLHGVYSDDYITTEILTGHPAMVSNPFHRDVVRKYWLTHDVLRALGLRTIEGVAFVDGDIHRQHVRWSGEGEVWVNRAQQDWHAQDVVLPSYGFLAKVNTPKGLVTASIERKQGLIVETAVAPGGAYFNGRLLADDHLPIHLKVLNLKDLGGGHGQLELEWDAQLPLPAGWSPFLHFCDPEGEIVFQAVHTPKQFTANSSGRLPTRADFRIPDSAQDGQKYELLYGVYHQQTGRRLILAGPDKGDNRIRLGQVAINRQNEMNEIEWRPFDAENDPFLARHNPDAVDIDFGMVKTAGGLRISRTGDTVVVTPLPGQSMPNFTIEVRWDKLPWSLPLPRQVVAVGEDGSIVGRTALDHIDGDRFVLSCDPRVFAYQLTADEGNGGE